MKIFIPSKEFVYHFKKKYPEITEHFAGNIKQSIAAATKELINKYFDPLQENLEDIPPELIYNYDKTNLSDNLRKKSAC